MPTARQSAEARAAATFGRGLIAETIRDPGDLQILSQPLNDFIELIGIYVTLRDEVSYTTPSLEADFDEVNGLLADIAHGQHLGPIARLPAHTASISLTLANVVEADLHDDDIGPTTDSLRRLRDLAARSSAWDDMGALARWANTGGPTGPTGPVADGPGPTGPGTGGPGKNATVTPETVRTTVDVPTPTIVTGTAAGHGQGDGHATGIVTRVEKIADTDASQINISYERLERYIEQVLADETRHIPPEVERDLIEHRRMLDAWARTEAQDPIILERIVAGYSRILPGLLDTDSDIDPSAQGGLQAQELRARTRDLAEATSHLGDPSETTAADQLIEETLPALAETAGAAAELAAEVTDDPDAKASMQRRIEDFTSRIRSGNKTARGLVDALTESRAILGDAIRLFFIPSTSTGKAAVSAVTGAVAYIGWVTETIHAIWHWLPLT